VGTQLPELLSAPTIHVVNLESPGVAKATPDTLPAQEDQHSGPTSGPVGSVDLSQPSTALGGAASLGGALTLKLAVTLPVGGSPLAVIF
jgi:hypothetical protein